MPAGLQKSPLDITVSFLSPCRITGVSPNGILRLMQIIPAINARDFFAVREMLLKTAQFLPTGGWIHIDVADRSMTPNITWGNPDEFKRLKVSEFKKIHFEVHLMTRDGEARAETWRAAGAERIIVPVELLDAGQCAADIMPSLSPRVTVAALKPFFGIANQFQILAVPPGVPGQNFQEDALQKIAFVRAHAPSVILEVDGGITPDTGFRALAAGADILVSSSYIWKSDDPGKAYQQLCAVSVKH